MRYFVCAFDDLSIGIPADCTARIVSLEREAADAGSAGEALAAEECDNADTNVGKAAGGRRISLAAICGVQDAEAPHGLVLKSGCLPAVSGQEGIQEIMLLTPKIKADVELPENGMHAFPSALAGALRSFSGVCFHKSDMILLLDPNAITGHMP
jgi:hypothetical protein